MKQYVLFIYLFAFIFSFGTEIQNSFVEEAIKNGGQLGIDVSVYEGKIKWKEVKADGVNFAILRTTTKGGAMDKTFEYNYKEALKHKLSVGGYHFSYSLSKKEAIADAENLIKKLKGKKLTIYIDLEWSEQRKLGKKGVTQIAKAFIKTMKKAGYTVDVYSNVDWYKNAYYPEQLKALGCKFCIAKYGKNTGKYYPELKPNIGEYIWQYTDKGKVKGIVGNVDMNMKFTSKLEEDSGNGEEQFNLNELIQEGIRNGGTPGIDVSSYQDTIDWDKVKKQELNM